MKRLLREDPAEPAAETPCLENESLKMMKKNSTEEATTFTPLSRPSPHLSRSSCIVKNALIVDINTMNVHNTSAITVIDERRDIEYRTALIGIIEVGDFNHSGGYCYELLFFSDTR